MNTNTNIDIITFDYPSTLFGSSTKLPEDGDAYVQFNDNFKSTFDDMFKPTASKAIKNKTTTPQILV